ncbi:uncharacterized protein LOC110837988 [Zootermopsis nevadensis]|uniref:MD-2-related lipid-recognition domain-containing protein n=1 Tax=Zootermopsis nevadensis TaxID=136037 RepID=A0A067QPH1_ZOONE|nr:uncharacterized protein LOC110837988 [Zootermopsis nevadensis]KDR10406.1 hypothetical protein L798_15418 [Zootermopsis nevadensis]
MNTNNESSVTHINRVYPACRVRLTAMLATLCAFLLAWSASASGYEYKILYVDAKVTKSSPEYFGKNLVIEVLKYNDTMPVLNCSFTLLKAFPEDMTVEVEGLTKQNNNVYKAGAFRTSKMKYCDFLVEKPQYAGVLTDFGNMVKRCPMSAGKYVVNNAIVDETRFPRLPGIKGWRLDVTLKVKKTTIFKVSIFVRIDS